MANSNSGENQKGAFQAVAHSAAMTGVVSCAPPDWRGLSSRQSDA